MGLDTVEIVMEIEETFDITIPDEEAEKIQTIGDAYRYVLSRLEGQLEGMPRCLSAATFYRLRRQLMSGLRVERRRIRPASALDDLIPGTNRRAEWERLGEGLGWRLPALVRPAWVGEAFLGLLLSWAVMLIGAWAWPGGCTPEAAFACILVFLVGAIGIGGTLYEHTRPLAIVLPAPDIRGLVPILLTANAAKIRDHNPHGWSPPEVWEMLIAIVASCAGVAPDQLTESTSFVNDLGLD